MKILIRILIGFIGVYALNAQGYKNDFRADVCQCLEEERLKRILTENAYKTCLRETLPKYAAQIDAQIVEEDVNKKYYLGQLARKELLISMTAELIYTCKVYYEHINFERNSKKLIARENAKESTLEKYDQMVALTPNAMAYFLRAQLHFNLGNIGATEADIIKSLELNPNKENVKSTRHELLLLAWVYEEQERFTEAIELYDLIYLGDLDTEVAQLRALADKKAGGTIANIPSKATTVPELNRNKTRRRQNDGRTIQTEAKGKAKAPMKVKKTEDTTAMRKLFRIKG